MKITKQSKGIESGNPTDYIFWSKYPSQLVKYRGTITVTSSGDSDPTPDVTATYNHGFGYKPQFMAFTRSYLSENYSKFAFADYVNLDFNVVHEDAGANIYEAIQAHVTDQDFVVTVNLSSVVSGSQTGIVHTYTIDFVLFMEEASGM